MSKIAIDFDGTICDRKGIPRKDDYMADKPTKDALEAVWWLFKQGFEPYILTNRRITQWPGIRYWLFMNGFPSLKITNRKLPKTTMYIDDRAIRFENNWQSICKMLG